MNLTRVQRLVLGAVEVGCSRPPQMEMLLGKNQGEIRSVLAKLKRVGIVDKSEKDWCITDHNWRAYETRSKKQRTPQKQQMATKTKNAALEQELDPTLHKLIGVMCFAIDEADARGIARSDIDVARVLEACRELDVPAFRWE